MYKLDSYLHKHKMFNHKYTISGASNKPIHIDLTTSDLRTANPLVIFVHGFKGFKDWGTHHLVATYFAQQGLNFLKFNFSHSGINNEAVDHFDDLEGFAANTFSKEVSDLNHVIDFALSGENFAAPPHIYLIGHSLGGGISIICSAKNKTIKKLATWASISSFRNLWTPAQEKTWKENKVLYFANTRTNQQMPIYSTLLEDLDKNYEMLDILASAKQLSQPWLIIHGDEDPAVHYSHAQELHEKQTNSKLMLIPHGDHVFGARHPWESAILPELLKCVCDATISFMKNDV